MVAYVKIKILTLPLNAAGRSCRDAGLQKTSAHVFVAALHMSPEKLRIGGRKVKPVIGGSYSWAKLL